MQVDNKNLPSSPIKALFSTLQESRTHYQTCFSFTSNCISNFIIERSSQYVSVNLMIIPPIFILCTPFSFIDFFLYHPILSPYLIFFLSPHLFCLLYSIGFFFNWFVRVFTSGKHEHASDKHHLNQTLPLEKLTCFRETEKERKE